MEHVMLDIMIDDRFYCSVKWSYNPIWTINLNELENEILHRLPTLKGQQFQIHFPDNFGFKRSKIS